MRQSDQGHMAVEAIMGYTQFIDLEFALGYVLAQDPQPGWKWAISAAA